MDVSFGDDPTHDEKSTNAFGKSSLMIFIEAIGLLTALSFAYSAIVNFILFRIIYGVNFFSIATSSDVIMNGFVNLGLCIMLICIVYTAQMILRVIRFNLIILQDRIFRTNKALFYELRKSKYLFDKVQLIVLAGLLLYFTLGMIHGAFLFKHLPDSYDTGLKISETVSQSSASDTNNSDSILPKRCAGSVVEWVGTSTAIVRCGGKAIFIKDITKLTLEPVQTIAMSPEVSARIARIRAHQQS